MREKLIVYGGSMFGLGIVMAAMIWWATSVTDTYDVGTYAEITGDSVEIETFLFEGSFRLK